MAKINTYNYQNIAMNKITDSIGINLKPIIRVFSLTIIFSIVLSSTINAQTLERHQAITAYVYNFANNIQWQNEEAIKEFQFLIIGEDKDVFNEMLTLSNTKTLRGKPIKIVSKPSVENIDGVHLIYITKNQENSLTELFDKIEGKNILLISDGFQDKRLVMINFIEGEEETLSFEINKANIINQNLRFTADLVLFGGTEIDVAALYREGQQSLRSLQKHTDNLESNLSQLESTIASRTEEMQVLKDSLNLQMIKMLAQNESLNKQNERLNKQTLKIQEQQKTLSNQSQSLEEKQTDIRTQNRKITEQQNILDDQYRESVKQKEDLKKGNELLQAQKDKIVAQSKNLDEKTGTIDQQKNMLVLLVIITLLIIVLVFLIYNRYKSKQKLNIVLETKVEERTNELRTSNEKLLAELSARKQAEEKLRKSEKFSKKIIESMSDGFSILEENGVHIDANLAFCEMTGFAKEELIGVGIPHPYWPEEEYGNIQEAFVKTSKGNFESFELVFKKKNGERFPVLVNPSQIKDEVGNVVSNFATVVDITKRKQAEEEIKKSHILLQQAEEISNQGAWEWDIVKEEWTFSENWLRVHGCRLSGITREELMTISYPEDAPEVEKAFQDALKGGTPYNIEHRIVRQNDGEVRYVRAKGNIILNNEGQALKMYGVAQDITDSKMAKEALRESEAKLKALFASLTEMVVIHELVLNTAGEAIDYRIIDCNKVFTEFTGIRKEDAIGKLASQVYQTTPPPYLEKYARVALGGDPHEFNIFYPPSDKHFMISVVSPQSGKFATITTDISAMMEIQEMIIAKNKEMENYLYVASHDLRTPLVNIQGFSQRLKKQADSIKILFADKTLEPEILHQLAIITDENIPKTLRFVFSNIEKMDTLINGLLRLSRTGRVEMNIQEIDMNELFANILQSLDFQIKEAQCEIHINPLPVCYGDAALLDQLFANIISNALKYSDSERALEITVDAKKRYNKVVYTISDNGKGIAQKHLEHIWDVFYRIDPRSGKTGEGIGLSLVKRIAEKHKGKVWAESEENKGSVFYIELNNHSFTEF